MKLAIVGSREFNDYALLCKTLSVMDFDTIISGGARGADYLAKKYACEHNITYIEFPADWNTYGRRAGYIRNCQIIDTCDECLAFWDGQSKGTGMDIDLCQNKNKNCTVVYFKDHRKIQLYNKLL